MLPVDLNAGVVARGDTPVATHSVNASAPMQRCATDIVPSHYDAAETSAALGQEHSAEHFSTAQHAMTRPTLRHASTRRRCHRRGINREWGDEKEWGGSLMRNARVG